MCTRFDTVHVVTGPRHAPACTVDWPEVAAAATEGNRFLAQLVAQGAGAHAEGAKGACDLVHESYEVGGTRHTSCWLARAQLCRTVTCSKPSSGLTQNKLLMCA